MSSQETKKSAAKFGKFGSKKASVSIKVPKLTKPSDEDSGGPAVSVEARPAPRESAPPPKHERGETEADRTEELPEEELLDESDLELLDDSSFEDDGEVTQASPDVVSGSVDVALGVTSGTVESTPETVKTPLSKRPVDPYGATEAISANDVAELRAIKAASDASLYGVVAGELPGVSGDALASSADRPNTAEDEAAAVAALDSLDEPLTVEDSMVGMAAHSSQPMPAQQPMSQQPMLPQPRAPQRSMQPQPMMPSPAPGAVPNMMSPVPGAVPNMMSPVPGAVPNMMSPVPGAMTTPYPGYGGPPPEPMAPAPAPGSMEAARNASWKTAHPSARRWAKRRDHTGAGVGRRTPSPSRIGAGLILIGIGIYLLAIFIPAHRPDAPTEAERTEAGKVWKFSETQHSLAAALAFGFVALGLFGAIRGAVYRREVTANCKACQMKVEATRAGLVLKCHNGGHTAGLATSSIAMLAAFAIIGITTLVLLLSASLG